MQLVKIGYVREAVERGYIPCSAMKASRGDADQLGMHLMGIAMSPSLSVTLGQRYLANVEWACLAVMYSSGARPFTTALARLDELELEDGTSAVPKLWPFLQILPGEKIFLHTQEIKGRVEYNRERYEYENRLPGEEHLNPVLALHMLGVIAGIGGKPLQNFLMRPFSPGHKSIEFLQEKGLDAKQLSTRIKNRILAVPGLSNDLCCYSFVKGGMQNDLDEGSVSCVADLAKKEFRKSVRCLVKHYLKANHKPGSQRWRP